MDTKKQTRVALVGSDEIHELARMNTMGSYGGFFVSRPLPTWAALKNYRSTEFLTYSWKSKCT